MNMLKGYTQAGYSSENWKILLDIKAAADAEIDNAATVADVTAALNDAEAAMAAVPTLLDDAKAAAHASLNAAFAGYAQGDYSTENWTILLNAMTMGDTDHAACVADVTKAVNNAEAAMAAIHTLLTDAKIAARAGLEAVLAGYSQADYFPDDWTQLNGFKSTGDTAVDEAADLAGVEAAQSAATAGMEGVQTIARILAVAKCAAHDALAAAWGNYSQSDYTSDDWTALTAHKTAGDEAIEEATDLAGVEAAQSAAVAGMDCMQTIAQILAAAKCAAHGALQAALETYSDGDYSGDDWTALNAFKTSGDAGIDEAADLSGVEAALTAAAAGMEGVRTIAQTLAAAKCAAHDVLAAAFEICESNDTAEDMTALDESEAVAGAADDAVADPAEEPAAVDVPTVTKAEAADACMADDALSAPQDVPAASDGAPDAEKSPDLDPALESVIPDAE